MSKSNERQSFETDYESIRRNETRQIQRGIKQINYKKINKIVLIIISIIVIFSIINNCLKNNEKSQIIEKYEQSENQLKEENEKLKIENDSLHIRLQNEESQFDVLLDKFLQICFQEPKQTE